MKQKFPDKIVVTWECPERDEAFMVVSEKIQDVAVVGEKIKAAIYKLECVTEVTCEVKAT